MKINLGCGYDYKVGWCNVDNNEVRRDVQHDLRSVPFPFVSGSANVIEANAVLEHLPIRDQIRLINECWRILKEDGELIIRVPHYTSFHSYQDIEHVKGYAYHSLDTFVKGLQEHSMGDYSGRMKFSKIERKLVFGKGIQKWNVLVEWLANKFPDAWEQSFLSAWPAEGVHYYLTK